MDVYKGFQHYTSDELNLILSSEENNPFLTNQYVIVDNESISRWDGSKLVPLVYDIKTIKPRNIEQKMAFDLLDNNEIPVKLLTGVAGGGKTKIAFEFALKKLRDYHDPIERILILRNPATVGKDLGLLPGTKEDKMKPWTKTIKDIAPDNDYGWMYHVQFDTPAYQQGITWNNTFTIVEEAQMLCEDLFQMLGSRVGKNSKIVFAGDYKQAFDNKYKGNKNGLLKGVQTLAGNPLVGMVEMQKSERSKVAQLFATMW